jgi:hypothetical protein
MVFSLLRIGIKHFYVLTVKNKWKKCVYALLWNVDEYLPEGTHILTEGKFPNLACLIVCLCNQHWESVIVHVSFYLTNTTGYCIRTCDEKTHDLLQYPLVFGKWQDTWSITVSLSVW